MTGRKHHNSRRSFITRTGLGVAATVTAPGVSVLAGAEASDLDALVKRALEGSPIRLTDVQIQDLKREIESMCETLAKVRAFRVRTEVEPSLVFRAR